MPSASKKQKHGFESEPLRRGVAQRWAISGYRTAVVNAWLRMETTDAATRQAIKERAERRAAGGVPVKPNADDATAAMRRSTFFKSIRRPLQELQTTLASEKSVADSLGFALFDIPERAAGAVRWVHTVVLQDDSSLKSSQSGGGAIEESVVKQLMTDLPSEVRQQGPKAVNPWNRQQTIDRIFAQVPRMRGHPETDTMMDDMILPLRRFAICCAVSGMLEFLEATDSTVREALPEPMQREIMADPTAQLMLHELEDAAAEDDEEDEENEEGGDNDSDASGASGMKAPDSAADSASVAPSVTSKKSRARSARTARSSAVPPNPRDPSSIERELGRHHGFRWLRHAAQHCHDERTAMAASVARDQCDGDYLDDAIAERVAAGGRQAPTRFLAYCRLCAVDAADDTMTDQGYADRLRPLADAGLAFAQHDLACILLKMAHPEAGKTKVAEVDKPVVNKADDAETKPSLSPDRKKQLEEEARKYLERAAGLGHSKARLQLARWLFAWGQRDASAAGAKLVAAQKAIALARPKQSSWRSMVGMAQAPPTDAQRSAMAAAREEASRLSTEELPLRKEGRALILEAQRRADEVCEAEFSHTGDHDDEDAAWDHEAVEADREAARQLLVHMRPTLHQLREEDERQRKALKEHEKRVRREAKAAAAGEKDADLCCGGSAGGGDGAKGAHKGDQETSAANRSSNYVSTATSASKTEVPAETGTKKSVRFADDPSVKESPVGDTSGDESSNSSGSDDPDAPLDRKTLESLGPDELLRRQKRRKNLTPAEKRSMAHVEKLLARSRAPWPKWVRYVFIFAGFLILTCGYAVYILLSAPPSPCSQAAQALRNTPSAATAMAAAAAQGAPAVAAGASAAPAGKAGTATSSKGSAVSGSADAAPSATSGTGNPKMKKKSKRGAGSSQRGGRKSGTGHGSGDVKLGGDDLLSIPPEMLDQEETQEELDSLPPGAAEAIARARKKHKLQKKLKEAAVRRKAMAEAELRAKRRNEAPGSAKSTQSGADHPQVDPTAGENGISPPAFKDQDNRGPPDRKMATQDPADDADDAVDASD